MKFKVYQQNIDSSKYLKSSPCKGAFLLNECWYIEFKLFKQLDDFIAKHKNVIFRSLTVCDQHKETVCIIKEIENVNF